MKYFGRQFRILKEGKILLKNPLYVFRYFFSLFRSKTLIDYNLSNNGFSFYPSHIVWEITNKCNLNCEMCWLQDFSGIKKDFLKNELNFEEITKIADELSIFKPLIYITGGEPFLREDMIRILKYLHKKKFVVTLTTNGTLITSKIAKTIGKDLLDGISFSLDGNEEIHDKIRGEGNFEKTIKGIKNVIKNRKGALPIVKINFTISKQNYKILSDFIELTKSLNADEIQFQHLWFTDRKHAESHRRMMKKLFRIDCEGINNYISDPQIDSNELKNIINRLLNTKTDLSFSFYPNIRTSEEIRKFYNNINYSFRKRCVNPWFSASIKPNGNLCPCPDYYIPEYTFGNLKNHTFKELWMNKKARVFRSTLKRMKYFPGCLRCCGLFGI